MFQYRVLRVLRSLASALCQAKRFFTQFLRHMPKSRAKVLRFFLRIVFRVNPIEQHNSTGSIAFDLGSWCGLCSWAGHLSILQERSSGVPRSPDSC